MQPDASKPEPWCERLFDESAAKLLLYGRALSLSQGEAEDVLQDTFLALLRRDLPPDDPGHYVVRAFRNRALNFRRSLWRRLTREWESRRWFEPAAAEDEREAKAMRALAGLPVVQREVIVLKIWHDLTFEEIARVTGVPANTAAGRYRYGLQKLRQAYGNNDSELAEPGPMGGAPAWLATPSTQPET